MAGILAPDGGSVTVRGKLSALIELGAGFQLDYNGRENLYLNASLLGLSRAQIDQRFGSIVDFAELRDQIEDPVRTYSSGMYMRLAFAIAVHVDPEILLVDEILAVGDESFQRKCLDRIDRFLAQGGTLVLVSHNLGAVRNLCDQAIWIEGGSVREAGRSADVVDAYLEDVSARDREASRRPGERPAVELGDARLLGPAGEPVSVMKSGQNLFVEIPYHVNRVLENPVFAVVLSQSEGVKVHEAWSYDDGVRIGPLVRDGSLRFEYRALPLLPGTYRVTVAVFDGPHPPTWVDMQYQRYSFRVSGSDKNEGVLRLDYAWVPVDVPLDTEQEGGRRITG
jgi:ABC-type polysaccharide/polyol phosphate transport system ATPase subunit